VSQRQQIVTVVGGVIVAGLLSVVWAEAAYIMDPWDTFCRWFGC
jgi:hypothetical protein